MKEFTITEMKISNRNHMLNTFKTKVFTSRGTSHARVIRT